MEWRKKRRRRRKQVNPALFLSLIGLSLLFGMFEQSAQSPAAARVIRTVPESYSFDDYTVPVVKEPASERLNYPYSVIRGGVRDRDELLGEIRQDHVVAEHYTDFNAFEARLVRVRDDKRVYVSYRIDDKVFWTSRQITLRRGEALISDGQNLARARCGNRVSVVPQDPVSKDEPPPEVFNTPTVTVELDFPATATIPDEPMPLFEELRPPFIYDFPIIPTIEDTPLTELFPPLNPPYFFVPPVFFVEPEVPEVPEPGTLVLIASVLGIYFLLRRFVLKRSPGAGTPGRGNRSGSFR